LQGRRICDKAVPAARYGFNELGRFRIVAENQPNLPDAKVQALLKINKSGAIPDLMSELLPGDELARSRREGGQNFRGLRLKPNGFSLLAKFVVRDVQLEDPESYPTVVTQGASLGLRGAVGRLLYHYPQTERLSHAPLVT
jgi:hypothetical protein